MDRIDSGLASTKDEDTRSKSIAYKRREWLSALLETGNEKVIAAYKKYEQINPEPIEHPGFNRRTEIWAGSTSPLTVEKLSSLSNAQIAEYLINFKETEVFRKSDPTERGLAQTLERCVEANPQKFTDNLLPFEDVSSFYQSSLLHGLLKAWKGKKVFDWKALLEFIRHILSSVHFWSVQYKIGFNYRNWCLSAAADLIAEGTKDDTHAFDTQLLPLAEEILLILVDKAQQSVSTLDNLPTDVLNSDRGRVFSAMIDYALRFARTNEYGYTDCRWPYAIRADFTKRLDRSVEPSLEFSYTLGFHLPYLSDLDKEWVRLNINHIFPQQDEVHWQAAFSGYLLSSRYPHMNLYVWLKANGHYRKALNTNFADREVQTRLVSHLCIGWVIDWETLNDDTSLIYQLIYSGDPNLLFRMVDFFLIEGERLCQSDDPEKIEAYGKVKAKVRPAWRSLFEVLSQNRDVEAYQIVLGWLSGWLRLIDTIDAEVLGWVKESVKYINKPGGYGVTLSRFFKALLKHASETPRAVGKIYLDIPQRVLKGLQTEEYDVKETVQILYKNGHKDIAAEICDEFGKAGVYFLRDLYEQQHQT